MKIALVWLKKNNHAITHLNGKGMDISMIGCALIAEGAHMLSNESGITVDEAYSCIIDSLIENKPVKCK